MLHLKACDLILGDQQGESKINNICAFTNRKWSCFHVLSLLINWVIVWLGTRSLVIGKKVTKRDHFVTHPEFENL